MRRLVAIGASAGGFQVLSKILGRLPVDFLLEPTRAIGHSKPARPPVRAHFAVDRESIRAMLHQTAHLARSK